MLMKWYKKKIDVYWTYFSFGKLKSSQNKKLNKFKKKIEWVCMADYSVHNYNCVIRHYILYIKSIIG